jgi:3'(2'), 5'-bisphosphate nucleotidase
VRGAASDWYRRRVSIPHLQDELRGACDIAQEAGRLILAVYATDFGHQEKAAGAGPVTEADSRANDYIVQQLREAFPADGIIAEESKDNSDARRFKRCWYVDPLDGTKEFIARNGEFAVHIGLAIEGEARLGVVYKPVDRKLYAGVVDGGSTLEVDGQSRDLHVSSTSEVSSLRLLVSRSYKSRGTELVREKLGIHHLIECGSVGVKCGLLAEGAADVYLHMSPKSSRWDSCAPEALLRGAGGRFTDLWGAAYRYDGAELTNLRGILACNAAAYDVMQPVVQDVVESQGT